MESYFMFVVILFGECYCGDSFAKLISISGSWNSVEWMKYLSSCLLPCNGNSSIFFPLFFYRDLSFDYVVWVLLYSCQEIPFHTIVSYSNLYMRNKKCQHVDLSIGITKIKWMTDLYRDKQFFVSFFFLCFRSSFAMWLWCSSRVTLKTLFMGGSNSEDKMLSNAWYSAHKQGNSFICWAFNRFLPKSNEQEFIGR